MDEEDWIQCKFGVDGWRDSLSNTGLDEDDFLHFLSRAGLLLLRLGL